MEPVKRSYHNFTYTGTQPGHGDLSGFKGEGEFTSHWKPNSDELAALLAGGDVELTVQADPVPPVSLGVLDAQDPLPADPSIEVVEINEVQYRVPPAVAEEIADLRRGVGDKLITFQPNPEDTVIVTVPDTASKEMTEAILGATAEQFPGQRVAVLPESLGIHTKAVFTELIEAGSEMANLILHPAEARDLSERTKAAETWERLTNGG